MFPFFHQVKDSWLLEGGARYSGAPPWVQLDGRLYYGEEENVVDYWSDFVYDGDLHSPGLTREEANVSEGGEARTPPERYWREGSQLEHGMTKQRQKEIHSAMYNMLGRSEIGDNGGDMPPPLLKTVSSIEYISPNHVKMHSREWQCLLCTLINHDSPACIACGTIKPSSVVRHHPDYEAMPKVDGGEDAGNKSPGAVRRRPPDLLLQGKEHSDSEKENSKADESKEK